VEVKRRRANTTTPAGIAQHDREAIDFVAARIASFHDRPNVWGWERDFRWCLTHGEDYWHRCDVRWLAATAGGELEAEGPQCMFFRFATYFGRAAVHKRMFERGVHCLRFPGKVLAIQIPWSDNGCDECREGAVYAP
jgi:hypothetical protein